jgi:hypothetical protein
MEYSKDEARSHTSNNNSLIENRFKILLFLYRLGGIPLNMKSVSTLNAVYNATVIVCFYITYICVGVDLLVHRHQLKLAMQNLRIYLGMLMVTWTHFSVR